MGWLSRLFKSSVIEEAAKTARDPMCNMDVSIDSPAATSVYQGQIYYFCAVGCKKAFDQDPEKYLSSKSNKEIESPD
ncbi:YHS domain-containing protein [Chloroflexota bacterium]